MSQQTCTTTGFTAILGSRHSVGYLLGSPKVTQLLMTAPNDSGIIVLGTPYYCTAEIRLSLARHYLQNLPTV